jgi:hypothetical protein
MTMIYEPQLIFNASDAVGGAIVKAAAFAAADFVAGMGKPWSFYVGMAFGGAAMATGIPGAATTLYIIGDSLDFWIFKSPDASEVRWFLNGIQQTSIDTYAATEGWELLQNTILNPNGVNTLQFINFGVSPNGGATGIPFLGLGDFLVYGANAHAYQGASFQMANDVLTLRTQDAESGLDFGAIPFYIPHGFTVAQLQTWLDLACKEFDDAMNVQVVAADLVMPMTVVGTVKGAPVANSLNERGGLLTFDTSDVYSDSIRLPGIKTALMPGDAVSVADALITAIVTRMTTATTGATIRPVTKHGFNWIALSQGKKSLRR